MGKDSVGKFTVTLVAAGQREREGEKRLLEDRPQMDQTAKSPTSVTLPSY